MLLFLAADLLSDLLVGIQLGWAWDHSLQDGGRNVPAGIIILCLSAVDLISLNVHYAVTGPPSLRQHLYILLFALPEVFILVLTVMYTEKQWGNLKSWKKGIFVFSAIMTSSTVSYRFISFLLNAREKQQSIGKLLWQECRSHCQGSQLRKIASLLLLALNIAWNVYMAYGVFEFETMIAGLTIGVMTVVELISILLIAIRKTLLTSHDLWMVSFVIPDVAILVLILIYTHILVPTVILSSCTIIWRLSIFFCRWREVRKAVVQNS